MIGQAILEGLAAGLILSVFVGPIFFTMLQLGVEHGFKAAFALALGQWVSDSVFILLAFWSADFVRAMVEDAASRNVFIWYSGSIGGVLLILFGLGLVFTKSVSTDGHQKTESLLDELEAKQKKSLFAYFAYFAQGLVINTINPTPLLFWMGLMGVAISHDRGPYAVYATFLTVIIIVIATDLAKIYLAKSIKSKLKPNHILFVRRIAGLVLAGFGLTLFIKVTVL